MIKKISILAFLSAILLCACDEIGENERFVVKNEVTVNVDTIEDGIDYTRSILIEEYTGQKCVNCIAGHSMMERIRNDFHKNASFVSIHAGSMAVAEAVGGLMTPDGDVYASKYDMPGYPSVVINRESTPYSDISIWYGKVDDAISKAGKSTLALALSASMRATPEGMSIDIDSDIYSKKEQSGISYQLILTEDSVNSFQIQPDGKYILEYYHNQVYRKAVNGTDGESIGLKEGKNTFHHSIKVDDAWNVSNLTIIGVAIKEHDVIQVKDIKVETPAIKE